MEKASIFLTTQEAIKAIITDFRQYEPQIMLFSGFIRLITDNRNHLKREPGKNGAWINRPGKAHMKWLDGPALVDHICEAISHTRWKPDLLAEACARVFQTRAVPDMDANTGEAGVRIETQMEDFVCRQCGFCCRCLDYHNEVTAEDVALWKASGRNDILKWVVEIIRNGNVIGYRAWINPVTGKPTRYLPVFRKKTGYSTMDMPHP